MKIIETKIYLIWNVGVRIKMNYLVFVLLIKMISGFEDINLDMYKNSTMYEIWTHSISFITNVGESS